MKAGEERELSLQQDLEATRALAAKVPLILGFLEIHQVNAYISISKDDVYKML